MLRILSTCFVFLICCQLAAGQGEDNPFPPKPVDHIKPPYCEFHIRKLTQLVDKIGANDILIIVSRLGKIEKSSRSRRLYNAKMYLTTVEPQPLSRMLPAESVISTQGDAAEGNGFLDFYVKGQLELRVYLNKNADFVVTSCIEGHQGVAASILTNDYFIRARRKLSNRNGIK